MANKALDNWKITTGLYWCVKVGCQVPIMRLRWHIRVSCEPMVWIKRSLFMKIYVYTDIGYWVGQIFSQEGAGGLDLLVHPCNLGVLVTELPSGRAVQCLTTTVLKCIDHLRFDLFPALHYKTSSGTNKPDEKKSHSWCLAVRIQDCNRCSSFDSHRTGNRRFVLILSLGFCWSSSFTTLYREMSANVEPLWQRKCDLFFFSSPVLLHVCSLGTM